MGLDIAAYRQLERDDAPERDAHGNLVDWLHRVEIDQAMLDFTEQHWPGRTAGLVAGVYSWRDSLEFRAGSYSGYGEWRRHLARLVGHPNVEAIWRGEVTAGPFIELINFSDCEGVIGPEVAAKLAADFARHPDPVAPARVPWFTDLYNQWWRAFDLAADRGAVLFQ